VPQITVSAPASGATLTTVTTGNTITWSTSSATTVPQVNLYYAPDGLTYDPTPINGATPVDNTGTYSWTIPETTTWSHGEAVAKIKVEDSDEAFSSIVFGESGAFTMTGKITDASITHTSYAAGAISDHTISFTAQGDLSVGDTLEIDYPGGYDLTGTLTVSGNSGATVSANDQTLVITLGTGIGKGTAVSLVVSGKIGRAHV